MLGYQMVLLWLILFFIMFYPLVKQFDAFHRTVAYWSYIMIFIMIFEFMLPFNYKYMCEKGQYYADNNKCYWSEDKKSLKDMICSKMYMELYSDYSLADFKYRQNLGDSGFHFVMFGELWHGAFSGLFSILTLYFLYTAKESKKFILSYFTLGIIQLTMIIWYVSPTILELFIEGSGNHISKWWWPPFMWNLPWFIIPPIMIYEGAKKILNN
jgi:hypothetical protein